jgi:hypothetical protein
MAPPGQAGGASSPSSSSFCNALFRVIAPLLMGYLAVETLIVGGDAGSRASALAAGAPGAQIAQQRWRGSAAAAAAAAAVGGGAASPSCLSCLDPDDPCHEGGTGPGGPGVPHPRVLRKPGKGLDACKVQRYLEPYVGRDKVRNTSWPFLSEDSYRQWGDWLIDSPEYGCPFDPEKVECGEVIVVKTDFLGPFLEKEHPRIRHPYVLVTAASDIAVPTFQARDFFRTKGRGNLYRWFGTQMSNDHPEDLMGPLPLGENSPGWYTTPGTGMAGHFTDPGPIAATLRAKIVAFLEGTLPKKDTVIVAFTVINNRPERTAALVGAEKLGYENGNYGTEEWPAVLHRSLFIWAPHGNPIGIDSHRIWEAVMGGSIPVVRAGEYESMLSCLPMVGVVRWEDVTWDDLRAGAREVLANLDAGAYDFRRAFLDYHAARVDRAAQRARAKCEGT